MSMKKALDYVYERMMNHVRWGENMSGFDVVELSVLENAWITLENELEKELEEKRFFMYYDHEKIEKIKKWAKEIKNPYTGGDDDFIILDIERGEYTYGESGELPLCDPDLLENEFKNKTLREIIESMNQ